MPPAHRILNVEVGAILDEDAHNVAIATLRREQERRIRVLRRASEAKRFVRLLHFANTLDTFPPAPERITQSRHNNDFFIDC